MKARVESDPGDRRDLRSRVQDASAARARRTRSHDPRHARRKALLFENVEGSDIPVAINTFGSYWRINQALGTENLEALAARVQQLVKPEIPTTLMEKMKRLPDLMKMASFPPKIVRSGICQQVVLEGDQADLTQAADHPMLAAGRRSEERAGLRPTPPRHSAPPRMQTGTGRYITLGGIHTRNPETGDRNIGMYRVQLFGPRICRHALAHAPRRRAPLPHVAEARREDAAGDRARRRIGPALRRHRPAAAGHRRAALRRLPQRRRHRAGASARRSTWKSPPTPRSSSKATSIRTKSSSKAPSAITPASTRWPTGIPPSTSPRSRTRKNPIYPTTIVGKPPMEDYFLGKATERIFLPLLQMIVPDIVDYALPISGVFHNCAFIKIRKEYPFQARRVMHAIWGAGQMAFTKFIVVVDEHVERARRAGRAVPPLRNCDPQRDSEIVHGPVDILDHASPEMGAGSKIGFDATRKLPAEGQVRRYPNGAWRWMRRRRSW